MKYATIGTTVLAAVAMTLSLSLVGCGNDNKSTSSATTTAAASSATTTAASGAPKSKLVPRTSENTAGPNYTIADYIKDQHIKETPIHPGDAGAPKIDLPLPDGWKTAGDKTPEWAYGAIVFSGPEAAGVSYPPNIIALLSKLEGNVDAQKLIDIAGGEVENLPGVQLVVPGETTTLSGYPAYQIVAGYNLNNLKAITAQTTIVIRDRGGLYILQLNATSDEAQTDILKSASETIDQQIKITP